MKHIHQWRIWVSPADLEAEAKSGQPIPPEHRPWTYRQCECGAMMRCLTWKLFDYPRDYRAYADEAWEDC